MQETCEVAYLFVPMVCHTGASRPILNLDSHPSKKQSSRD